MGRAATPEPSGQSLATERDPAFLRKDGDLLLDGLPLVLG
jgi:hypothetical protein